MSCSQHQSPRLGKVRDRIKKRTCSQFISSTLDDRCQCGRSQTQHSGVESNPGPSGCAAADPGEPAVWDPREHTRTEQSQDYGIISFRGFGCSPKYAQFTRIDQQTDTSTVWSLLTSSKLWDLPLPGLFLSVIGGGKPAGKSRSLETQIKQVFAITSVTTDAWLVTDGRAGWLNGLVAQGVQEEVERQQRTDYGPVLLGVASWGNVANNEVLETAGRFPAPVNYVLHKANHHRDCCHELLDHRHNHFLLVDDGTEGREGGWNSASRFRAQLEQHLLKLSAKSSASRKRGGVVVMVVAGGVETVEEVYQALTADTAVLVLTPTGGAADLLQHALDLFPVSGVVDGDAEEQMKKKVMETLETDREQTEHVVVYLKKCLEKRNLLNVFNLHTMGTTPQQQEAFLFTLLKPITDNSEDMEFKLSLAMACNFPPLARYCIQSSDSKQPQDYLHTAMLSALIHEKEDFVQLFLDSGLNLVEFLTCERLQILFDPVQAKCEGEILQLLRNTLKFPENLKMVRGIDLLMTDLFGDNRLWFYDGYFCSKTKTPEAAARLLFFWAVLFYRQKLAWVLWKEGVEYTAMALCASQLSEQIARRAEDHRLVQLENAMQKESRRWEQVAINVIAECFSDDVNKIHALLEVNLSYLGWRRRNLLNMCMVFEKQEFASESICCTVQRIWKPEDMPVWKVLLCTILWMFKPLISRKTFHAVTGSVLFKVFWRMMIGFLVLSVSSLCLLSDKDFAGLTVLPKNETASLAVSSDNETASLGMSSNNETASLGVSSNNDTDIGLCDYGVLYLFFLHTGVELLIYIWTGFNGWRVRSIYEMLRYVFLGLMLGGAIIGGKYAKAFFTFSIMCGWLSFTHLLFLDKSVGPLVVILETMVQDFIKLLPMGLLFITGSGVAYHSLMYPNTPIESWWSVLHSFFIPYFQIFGEIDLNHFQGLFIDPDNLKEIDGRHQEKAAWGEEKGTDPLTKYPDNNPLLPWILGMSLVMANVMYMCVVVGQLNFTFQRVTNNIQVVSRYQWARMVLFCDNMFWRCQKSRFPHNKAELRQYEGEAVERYLQHCRDTLND